MLHCLCEELLKFGVPLSQEKFDLFEVPLV